MSQDPKHLSAHTYTLLTKSTTCQSKLSILSEQLGTFKYEIEVIGAQFDIDKFLLEKDMALEPIDNILSLESTNRSSVLFKEEA